MSDLQTKWAGSDTIDLYMRIYSSNQWIDAISEVAAYDDRTVSFTRGPFVLIGNQPATIGLQCGTGRRLFSIASSATTSSPIYTVYVAPLTVPKLFYRVDVSVIVSDLVETGHY